MPDIWNHKTNFKVLVLAWMPDLELKRKSKVLLLCLDVLADLLSLGKREASYQKAKVLKEI